jgi:NADPH-dependent 2,4-dienoyl-CoA reductase/sulfur reductase-like enzyme
MNNSDKRLVPVQNSSRNPVASEKADIVIIGNGIAGLTAAIEARRLDPDKRIVIITDQIHPTINTPALKQFAVGKLTREQLLAYPAGTERVESIHLVNAHVEEIHAQSHYVTLNGKRGFGYDSLLIATGSYAMGLPDDLPGRNFDGVLTLHRLQDYLDLRRRLGEVSEAVVVGGGVHAAETVMGLLYWGIRVHWLIRGKTFMRQMFDETASDMVLNNIRRSGAIIHLETEVTGVVGRVGAVAGVITNQQEMIPCQLLLCCTGTRAVTTLATKSTVPIKYKNGIWVDDKLRTSVRDIYAAGDVAALRNPQTNAYETRAVWYAAVAQARIAGAMMVGHDELARQPFGVQWHATHLGELSMLKVGEPLSKDSNLTTLTDTGSNSYRRVTILGDRLVGYLSLGMDPPDSLAIKRIIDEGHSIRDVIKPLLKGQFDARSYISQQRSYVTRNMLTTRQLPPLLDGPVVESRRPSGDLAMTARVRETGPLDKNNPPPLRQTGPIQTPRRAEQSRRSEPVFLQEDEVNPFTGNLPAQKRRDDNRRPEPAFLQEEEINPFTGNLPTLARGNRNVVDARPVAANSFATVDAEPDIFSDEVNPFTGNLPTFSPPETTRRDVESRGSSLSVRSKISAQKNISAQQKQLNYKLWAYIDPQQENVQDPVSYRREREMR